MLRDYWYIVALAAVIAIISLQWERPIFLIISFFLWLLMLQYHQKIPVLITLLTCSAFFFFYTYIPTPVKPQTDIPSTLAKKTIYQGKVKGPVEQAEKKVEFLFRDDQLQENILVVFFPREEDEHRSIDHIMVGGTCQLIGKLQLPEQGRNPHQFDYQQYLLEKDITYQLVLNNTDDIECSAGGMMHPLYSVRSKLIQSTQINLRDDTVAWLHALVLGDKSRLDEDIVELFQRWSLSHILAISGLHIGIIVALVYMLLVRFSVVTKEKAQWFIICSLPLYAFIAGGQPSVWRASFMVLFVMLLNKFKWKLNFTDIISIVFLLFILVDPYIVYHVGFQLSFAVTFGIIVSQQWIARASSNMERIFQISFVSQMVILPLQVQYFSTFQPLSIIINLLVVPYFSFFVIPAMFGLIFTHFIPIPIMSFIEHVIMLVHQKFLFVLFWLDTYMDFPFVIGEMPPYFIAVYYVLFFVMMNYLERGQLKRAFTYGLFVCLCIVTVTLRPYFSPVGSVTMLDIGQGDAFIIELPYRKGVFFVDMGTTFEFPDFTPTEKVYKNRIKPYLLGQGITKIDTVFLSHEHLDHYGSLLYAAGDTEIDEVIISRNYDVAPEIEALFNRHDISVYRMDFNESIIRNGHTFHAVAPQGDGHDPNEDSLVLYSYFGGRDWLFTGDIGKGTEQDIIKAFPHLQFDVLKVAHHGSNTSTDPAFIAQTQPQVALISVGEHNTYGHPTKEVVETLLKEDVIIFRTDEHGAVQYIYRDDDGIFKPFLENKF